MGALPSSFHAFIFDRIISMTSCFVPPDRTIYVSPLIHSFHSTPSPLPPRLHPHPHSTPVGGAHPGVRGAPGWRNIKTWSRWVVVERSTLYTLARLIGLLKPLSSLFIPLVSRALLLPSFIPSLSQSPLPLALLLSLFSLPSASAVQLVVFHYRRFPNIAFIVIFLRASFYGLWICLCFPFYSNYLRVSGVSHSSCIPSNRFPLFPLFLFPFSPLPSPSRSPG